MLREQVWVDKYGENALFLGFQYWTQEVELDIESSVVVASSRMLKSFV